MSYLSSRVGGHCRMHRARDYWLDPNSELQPEEPTAVILEDFVLDNGRRDTASSEVVFHPRAKNATLAVNGATSAQCKLHAVETLRFHQLGLFLDEPDFGCLPGIPLNGTPHHPAVDFQSRHGLRAVSASLCARAPRRSNRRFHCLFLGQGTQNRWFVASRRTSAIDPRSTRGPTTVRNFQAFALVPLERMELVLAMPPFAELTEPAASSSLGPRTHNEHQGSLQGELLLMEIWPVHVYTQHAIILPEQSLTHGADRHRSQFPLSLVDGRGFPSCWLG